MRPAPAGAAPHPFVRAFPAIRYGKFYAASLQSLKSLQLEWAAWRENTPVRTHAGGDDLR